MLTLRSGLRCVSLSPWLTPPVSKLVSGIRRAAAALHYIAAPDSLDGSAQSGKSPNLKAYCNLQVWGKQMGGLDRLMAAAELPAAALISLADSSRHSGSALGCDEAEAHRQAEPGFACSAIAANHQDCAKDLALGMDLAEGLSTAADGLRHQDRHTAGQLLLHVSLQYACSPVQATHGAKPSMQSTQSTQSMLGQNAADVAPAGPLWQVHEEEGAQEIAPFMDLGEDV